MKYKPRRAAGTMCAGLVVSLVVLATGVGAPAAAMGDVKVTAGTGGRATVIKAQRPGDGRASIAVRFATGSYDDGASTGLTRLSQHTLIWANKRGDGANLFRDVYAASGTLEIETSVRASTFRLTAPRTEFMRLAPRLLSMLLTPALKKPRFTTAKKRALSESVSTSNEGSLVSFVAGTALFGAGADGVYQYNNALTGDAESYRNLSFRDVERHIKSKLVAARATISIAGDFDPRPFSKLLATKAGRSRTPVKPDLAASLPVAASRPAPAEVLLHAQVIELTTPKDAAVAAILAEVLQASVNEAGSSSPFPRVATAGVWSREWVDAIYLAVVVADASVATPAQVIAPVMATLSGEEIGAGVFSRARLAALARIADDDATAAVLAVKLLEGNARLHSRDVFAELEKMEASGFWAQARKWLARSRAITVAQGHKMSKGGGG